MAIRDVTVRLRAEVSDFNRQMAAAAQTTDKTSREIDANGQKIQTTMGRMVRSAEVNRQSWNTAGSAIIATGAAMTALGAAAYKTGIEYNTLQQTSRAALTTMLGEAEAANAQMDLLDDFARNSPFAKQVFIDAQRQMLGFGVEAEKVLPYLDAIQNAVAAMGGSNQDIAEIATILAKIASQGKITARELMQLGIHGIDAATLIGSAMDKTAGEIRESITAGSIDAGTALDALTDGMQERFGGAAENVKNTYEGAIDRIKAAWRDLASEFSTPLVDPDGGGLLITWANDFADALRQFEALPTWVKVSVVSLGTLVGLISLVGGGFLLLAPRIMDTVIALDRLGVNTELLGTRLKGFAKGGAITTGVVAGLSLIALLAEKVAGSSHVTVLGVQAVTSALLDMQNAGSDLVGVFDFSDTVGGILGQVTSVEEAARRLTDPSLMDRLMDVGGTVRGMLPWSDGATARTAVLEQFDIIGQALAALVSSGDAERAATQFEMLASQWEAGGGSAEELLRLMPAYSNALAEVENQAQLAAESTGNLTSREAKLADAQERAASAQERLTAMREAYHEEVDRWRTAMSDAFTGFVSDQGAFDAAVQANIAAAQKQAESANEATAEWARRQGGDVKTVTKTWEDFYDGVTVSARSYISELEQQIEAQQQWAENVTSVSERLAESFSGKDLATAREQLAALAESGPAGAGAIATLAGATDDELAEIVQLWAAGGADAATEFVNEFQQSADPFLEPRLDMQRAQQTLDQWSRQTVQLEVDVRPKPTGLLGQLMQQGIDRFNEKRDQVRSKSWQTPYYLPQGVRGYAGGGQITGPGTSTSDSIPIMASDGEWMHQAKAVDFWGHRAMDSINRMDVQGLWRELGAKGFRDGGAISQSAAPQIVTVPVESRYEEHAPIHMTFHGQSAFADGLDYADRRRQSVLGGR